MQNACARVLRIRSKCLSCSCPFMLKRFWKGVVPECKARSAHVALKGKRQPILASTTWCPCRAMAPRSNSAPPETSRPRATYWTTVAQSMDQAERLFYGACSSTLGKAAFCAEAAHLERESPEAGEYLRWLMVRGQTWPHVRS
jgi:hypothetical protein